MRIFLAMYFAEIFRIPCFRNKIQWRRSCKCILLFGLLLDRMEIFDISGMMRGGEVRDRREERRNDVGEGERERDG